jgi:hypothetical protein
MSDRETVEPAGQVNDLQEAMVIIERVTVQFPISQLVFSWMDVCHWLLNDVSANQDAAARESWLRRDESIRHRFLQRWRSVLRRALEPNPRQVSDLALGDANYDPLGEKAKRQPWGVELTRAFRAALAELGPVSEEAPVMPAGCEGAFSFLRAVKTQDHKWVLPVVSDACLLASEWNAILERLNEVVELALAFEGAAVVWLIGGLNRDVEGRLILHPQLSLSPPRSGTRVKPIYVLLGTAYEEQCPSVLPLVRAARDASSGLPGDLDALFNETPWHRVVIQLDLREQDYVLFNFGHMDKIEDQVTRRLIDLDQEPRGRHTVVGKVHQVPRPWTSAEVALPDKVPPSVLRRTGETAVSVEPAPGLSPSTSGPHQDAEELRRKGMAVLQQDPAVAQKYLLASTVLDNSSVDVWLTLIDLATTAKQKATFRREAEKVLRRQRQQKTLIS